MYHLSHDIPTEPSWKKRVWGWGRVPSHIPQELGMLRRAFSWHSKLDFAFLFSRNGVKELEILGVGLLAWKWCGMILVDALEHTVLFIQWTNVKLGTLPILQLGGSNPSLFPEGLLTSSSKVACWEPTPRNGLDTALPPGGYNFAYLTCPVRHKGIKLTRDPLAACLSKEYAYSVN